MPKRFVRCRLSLVLTILMAAASGLAAATQVSAAPAKVTIAPDGRLLINGQPTFFFGFAPGPQVGFRTPEGGDGWAEMAAGGMSVVRGWMPEDGWTPEFRREFGQYLDAAHARGVYVWPFLREMVELNKPGMREQLIDFIRTYRDHPAVLFWKSADEPEWGKLPVEPLTQAYELIRELDPNHPVWFCHAPRGTLETLRPYNPACDVLSIDIYPVSVPPGKHSLEPNKNLSMVGDYTRRTVELAGGRKMVFMVLQAAWSGVNPAHNPKNQLILPTFREARYMTYQAIICGANSLSYFGMPVALTGRDAELGWHWDYWRAVLRPLLAELKPGSELYPALIAPDAPRPVKFSGSPRIEVRCKEVGVYLYIFAAAREGPPLDVEFAGVSDGEVSVVHEGRTLQARDGRFTDAFREHDVHVYRALRILPPATKPVGSKQ